jgi:hypothetical protein
MSARIHSRPVGQISWIGETEYEGGWASEANPRASHHIKFHREGDGEDNPDDDRPKMYFYEGATRDKALGKGNEIRRYNPRAGAPDVSVFGVPR